MGCAGRTSRGSSPVEAPTLCSLLRVAPPCLGAPSRRAHVTPSSENGSLQSIDPGIRLAMSRLIAWRGWACLPHSTRPAHFIYISTFPARWKLCFPTQLYCATGVNNNKTLQQNKTCKRLAEL